MVYKFEISKLGISYGFEVSDTKMKDMYGPLKIHFFNLLIKGLRQKRLQRVCSKRNHKDDGTGHCKRCFILLRLRPLTDADKAISFFKGGLS